MGTAEKMRQRLLYLEEKNIFNYSILVGDTWFSSIVRTDMSKPNYGKIESYSYGMNRGQSNRSTKPICHVFSYKQVNGIALSKFDSKGNEQFDDTLSTNISTVVVPTVQLNELTVRETLQNIQSLPANLQKDFNLIIGANAYEALMKYATDDPDMFKCVIGWYDLGKGGQSMTRLDISYEAIETISLHHTIYGALSDGPNCTPDKHKLILPWE